MLPVFLPRSLRLAFARRQASYLWPHTAEVDRNRGKTSFHTCGVPTVLTRFPTQYIRHFDFFDTHPPTPRTAHITISGTSGTENLRHHTLGDHTCSSTRSIPNVIQLTIDPMGNSDTASPPDTETLCDLRSIGVSISSGGVVLVITGEGFGSSYPFHEINSSGASPNLNWHRGPSKWQNTLEPGSFARPVGTSVIRSRTLIVPT